MLSVLYWRNDMAKTMYDILISKQKYRRPFSSGDDFRYFMENREKLGKFKRFAELYDSEENEFDIMRANILLRGLENKTLFEKEIANIASHGNIEPGQFILTLKERIIDQPYYNANGVKIYIPFFSSALNQIYTNEPNKLLALPYSELEHDFEDACIDPFDTYGAELFNSFFTSLVKIGSSKHATAFFYYDTNTVYIINDQGRLDCKFVLFDKYMKKPSYTHMMERIAPFVEAYFNNDRQGVVDALLKSNLISPQMHKLLTK